MYLPHSAAKLIGHLWGAAWLLLVFWAITEAVEYVQSIVSITVETTR